MPVMLTTIQAQWVKGLAGIVSAALILFGILCFTWIDSGMDWNLIALLLVRGAINIAFGIYLFNRGAKFGDKYNI